jgi:hypothetical protein
MEQLPPDGSDPRRAYLRLHVGIDAYLDTIEGRQKVYLVDLSQSGAHVALSQPEAVKEGVLTWLGFDTFAIAAWQHEDEVGLQFDQLLPLHVMVETRKRAPTLVLEMAQAWVTGDLRDN